MLIDSILDNSIIICPNDVKEDLIPQFNKNKDLRVKFFSKEEILEKVFFSYDDNAITYLMNKGLSYSNAKEIIDNLKGIKKGNKKLDNLFSIYEELNKNNLLKKDYLFRSLFKNKNVYVIGYSSLEEELKYLLKNELGLEVIYYKNEEGSYRPIVHECIDMEEEVNNLFIEIARLITKGVKLNDIYIFDYPSEYDATIKKYARIFNLPIEFRSDMTLKDSPLFIRYISLLKQGKALFESFDDVGNLYSYDYDAKKKLAKIVNDVMNVNGECNYIELLNEKAKRVKLKSKKYDNSIKITNISHPNGYVFMVGFSLGDYPSVHKDTDYLSDEEKIMLHKDTSIIKNRIAYDELACYITNQPNLYISRKLKEGKEEKYDSQLTKKLKLEKEKIKDDGRRFNLLLSEIEVAKNLEEEKKYGSKKIYSYALDDYLNSNGKKFSDIHLSFDHSFKKSPIFKNDMNMEVSYSKINEYYECPFMFFIKRVCKLGVFEDTFYTKLGKLFHSILEDSLIKEISLDDYKDKINEEFDTAKERFLFSLLLPQVLNVINKNKNFMQISNFNRPIAEHEFNFQLDKRTRLVGFADKIIFNDKEKEAIIIDYKTGALHFDKDKVKYGLNLQLPTYGLLLKNEFKDYDQSGIYIQRILEKNPDDKSYLLDGITKADLSLFERLDHTVDRNSKYISGINKTSKGFMARKNLILEDEFDELINEAHKVIEEAVKKIRNGEFDISPTLYKGGDAYCSSCPLSATCFHDEKDYRRVGEEKEEE